MKHKIRVHKGQYNTDLWYVTCRNPDCGDGIMTQVDPDDPHSMFGRTTWDAALAIGIAHQQNANGRGEHE